MDAMELVMMAVTLLAGAKGDLLDTMTTDQYWQSKNVTVTVEQLKEDAGPDKPLAGVEGLVKDLTSDDFKTRDTAKKKLAGMGPGVVPALRPAAASKDPEVAQVAGGLIEQFSKAGHARDIRRLMAIRTLGERKEASALGMLETMKGEKSPFVASYAERAAAAIEGKSVATVDARQTIAADAWLLPKDSGMVLQGKRLGWDAINVASVAQGMADNPLEKMRAMQMGNNAPAAPGKEEREKKATQELLMVAERVGDFRVDGMTIALSSNFDGDAGWFVTVMHGEYDPEALASTFKTLVERGGDKAEAAKIEGADAIGLDEGMLVMPSSKTLVIVYADDAGERARQAEAIVHAVKTGKGTLEESGALAKLLKEVDPQAAVWGAAVGMESLKKEAMFAGFDRLTLKATEAGKKLTFTITGSGSDAEKVKASQETLEAGVKSTVSEMEAEATGPEKEVLQPMVDLMKSLKTEVTGTSGTMTGVVPAGVVDSMLGEMGFMMMMEEGTQEIPGEVPMTQP